MPPYRHILDSTKAGVWKTMVKHTAHQCLQCGPQSCFEKNWNLVTFVRVYSLAFKKLVPPVFALVWRAIYKTSDDICILKSLLPSHDTLLNLVNLLGLHDGIVCHLWPPSLNEFDAPPLKLHIHTVFKRNLAQAYLQKFLILGPLIPCKSWKKSKNVILDSHTMTSLVHRVSYFRNQEFVLCMFLDQDSFTLKFLDCK